MVWFWGVLALIALGIVWKIWKDAVTQAELPVHQAREEDKPAAARRAHRTQLGYTAVVSVVATIILGLFAWFALVAPQLDVRQYEAKEALYRAGVEDRWESECAWVFYDMLDTPGGVLFYDNVPYDAAWCRALQRTDMLELPAWEFVEDAYDAGWDAGRSAVDAVTERVETLCFGSECADVQSEWYDLLDSAMDDNWFW